MTTENQAPDPAPGSRDAFEAALKTKPEARFWNTTDAMFWAFQAGAAGARVPAPEGAQAAVLRQALEDAATSLETVAKNAGRPYDTDGYENLLEHHDQVRGYAASRASAARAALAAPAPQATVARWTSIYEQAPEIGQDCIVWIASSPWATAPYATTDKWDEQREDPFGMGGPTIPVGPGWDENPEAQITHWLPLPAAPQTKEPTNDR